jgi:peptidyl-prolyl cis-trans isomerase A (cyclophilin A)
MRSRLFLLAWLVLAACSQQKKPEPPAAPGVKQPPPAEYHLKFETTKGDIVVEAKREWSPKGSDHFFELVQSGFYDGVKFHRVRYGFIAQFGINGDPRINRLFSSSRIPDDPVKLKNKRGTICYAKAGPSSRTTEVFFNLRDNPDLDTAGFSAFGKVIEGLDVMDGLSCWYGELAPAGRGPDPGKIHLLGNKYLEEKFPKLDGIKRVILLK